MIERESGQVLVHLVAQMDVRRSVADPAFDAQINLVGFLNLMEAGREHGLRRVVFSSTGGAIYGEQESFPCDENHPLRPVSPYGVAKLATEKYLFFYHAQYGIDYVAMRYANVYSPRQDPHVRPAWWRFLRAHSRGSSGDDLWRRRPDAHSSSRRGAGQHGAVANNLSGAFNARTGVETTSTSSTRHSRIAGPTGRPVPVRHAQANSGARLSCRAGGKELGWRPQVDCPTAWPRPCASFAIARRADE